MHRKVLCPDSVLGRVSLASMCCRPQLYRSRWLVEQAKARVVQDHSVVARCRERLESEAMELRRRVDFLVGRVDALEVLAVALVRARCVLSGWSGEFFVGARGLSERGRFRGCGSCPRLVRV